MTHNTDDVIKEMNLITNITDYITSDGDSTSLDNTLTLQATDEFTNDDDAPANSTAQLILKSAGTIDLDSSGNINIGTDSSGYRVTIGHETGGIVTIDTCFAIGTGGTATDAVEGCTLGEEGSTMQNKVTIE